MLVKRQDGRILNLGAAMQFDPIPNPLDDDMAFLARFPGHRNYIIKGMTVFYYFQMVENDAPTAITAEWVDEDHYVGATGKIVPS